MSRTPQEEANLKLVLDMFAQVLNPMDLERSRPVHFARLHPAATRRSSRAWPASRRSSISVRTISPLAVHDVKRAFVDGDHVTVHYHARRWPGDRGWAVIDIFRVADGMIAEHWDVMQDVIENGPESELALLRSR